MTIKFINLDAAQKDAYNNLKKKNKGPADPATLADLKKKLTAAKDKLPPIYRQNVCEPFVKIINGFTVNDFKKLHNPNNDQGFILFDIAQAILQDASEYEADATHAFEEVVSDLYDGFLSAEDRHNIKFPDHDLLPPLVKWGYPDDGPYTDTPDATISFNVNCAIVNLPPSHAHGVLVGWGCLAHETAGHDIVHADDGLLTEMAQVVKAAINKDTKIKNAKIRGILANYWSDRIDETISDTMGVLNMGPAASAVVIPYFRALLGSFGLEQKLRSDGPKDDEHPADILRIMLGSSVIRLLSFSGKNDWADAILKEGLKDITKIVLNGSDYIDKTSAQRSADIIAKALMQTPFTTLNGHSLQELQDWQDSDEKIVDGLRKALTSTLQPDPSLLSGAYAAHVVAAAIYEALLVQQEIQPLFTGMIAILTKMHDNNPSWGPLFVVHPGDLKRNYLISRPK
ncbi:MAG: hypothetical protein NTX61_02970 [Bacteroidetes bacterium]|nr:hypothetical protein [Bacteroidota bacterium]